MRSRQDRIGHREEKEDCFGRRKGTNFFCTVCLCVS